VHEMPTPFQQDESFPRLAEISIGFVDNGFIVRATGRGLQKMYVVQASSNEPSEFEDVLDVVRKIYHQVGGADEQPSSGRSFAETR
jgi:hypothetical protein